MNKYLEMHLKKYPNMQIEDKIKLLMQGYMGCGHLITNMSNVLVNLINEYNHIKDENCNDDIIEDVSDKYVRIYLKPFFDTYHTFGLLADAFTTSSKYKGNIADLYEELYILRQNETPENIAFIDAYIKSGNILLHHSQKYNELYHPHYVVIHRKELAKLLSKLPN